MIWVTCKENSIPPLEKFIIFRFFLASSSGVSEQKTKYDTTVQTPLVLSRKPIESWFDLNSDYDIHFWVPQVFLFCFRTPLSHHVGLNERTH